MDVEVPPHVPGMPGYVQRDWEVIDYKCFRLAGTDLWFRGPAPALEGAVGYFTVLGAAQSFGCFTADPYAALLARSLGVPALNLGYSGAGPAFYLANPELIERANAGRMCVVQVMSGRSTSNSLFDNPQGLAVGQRRADGRPTTSEEVLRKLLADQHSSIPLVPSRVVQRLLRLTRVLLPRVRRVVRESQHGWVRDMSTLLDRLTVPTVLLWFSVRAPAWRPRYHTGSALLGEFPHLVDEPMVAKARRHCDAYVECVSARGLPQKLVSRFTGEPVTIDLRHDRKEVNPGTGEASSLYEGTWTENLYYPSPEMHQDAATALLSACRRLLT